VLQVPKVLQERREQSVLPGRRAPPEHRAPKVLQVPLERPEHRAPKVR